MANYTREGAKAAAKELIRGNFSAITMPLTADGEVDEAGLRHNVRHCIDVIGAHGIYLHGYYGHFWLLTIEERKRAMEIVSDEVAGAVPLICRCAHQSMRDTIDLIHHAEEHGADFISLIGPAYGNTTTEMIYDYFDILGKETDLGFSVFNNAQTGYVMPPEIFVQLAEIPNVVALKNAVTPEHTNEIRRLAGDDILVVDPNEELFLANILEHGQQAIYTGTNYMYDTAAAQPMKDYVEAALAGDAARATELFNAMQPLRDIHHQWVIEPWKTIQRCPIQVVEYWSVLAGMKAGPLRPPLPNMTNEEKDRLAAELEAVGYVINRGE